MDRIAIIDMGTNTFHLLLAEIRLNDYRILYRNHEVVKIGVGGINEGIITEAACQRAIAAMKRFKKIIDEESITKIHSFGTSALRNAKNGHLLTDEIKTLTGISIRIISGDEEADLIYAGIQEALDLKDDLGLVMDIGAGSVEFIIGNREMAFWKQSFEIGGQRLLEKFQKNDPITTEEIAALDSCFQETLNPLLIALQKFKPGILIGSSGTFDTLSDIYCIRQGITLPPDAAETPLTLTEFYEIYNELIRKNRAERMNVPGMIDMRVDMIVVSCCLISYVLERHTFSGVRVSKYSLKEGVLAKVSKTMQESGGFG
jgi:Exopolyphosphatase